MEKLSELKKQLAIEQKKPKNSKNKALINDIQDQIWRQKAILKNEYRNRQAEKHMAEVNLNLSLWKRKNEKYAKIRNAKKNERLEAEKRKVEKIQQKKKAK